MYAEIPRQFNKTYRMLISHIEQEIDAIIHMGVFSGDKTGFVRLGHIYASQTTWQTILNTCTRLVLVRESKHLHNTHQLMAWGLEVEYQENLRSSFFPASMLKKLMI